MIGRTISHYEIVEQLGAGGMGVVYKARDTKLERFVALKFLPPHFSGDDELKQRFVQEAKAASALDHSSICTIHEISETEEGVLYMVMAFYEGMTLKEKIALGALEIEEAVSILEKVAEGLAVAHEHGIVHRDIKPANIFLTHRGETKILDFGLAKVTDASGLTKTGSTMGTLAYMPPEQLKGKGVDHRADIWALGAVFYEMLVGRSPFLGDNEGSLIHSILSSVPERPSVIRPGLPTHLEQIAAKALAKDIAARYQSVAALLEELRGARTESAPSDFEDRPTALWEEPALPAPAEEVSKNSIAVIDFVNYVGDPTVDWLCGGIAESMTVDLKKVGSLKVEGRPKIQQALAGTPSSELDDKRLLDVGARLGVRWICWGGFQKADNAIRLTAHFFDVGERRPLASIKLDGTMDDIFTLQDQLITGLIETLGLEITDSEAREIEQPETHDLKAYEYLAKGRQLIHHLSPESLAQAKGYLEKAIELDPEYALAYSGLGEIHSMKFIGTTDPQDLEQSISYLKKAVELDPELSDPYTRLTYNYSRQDRFAEALDVGRRAIELETDNPMSHYFLAVAHWLHGVIAFNIDGWPEAADHLMRVIELAPRFQPGYQILADLYIRHGQYSQAEERLKKAVEIEESGDFELAKFIGAITSLGRLALRQGELEKAWGLLDHALEVSGETDHVYAVACNALAHCTKGDVLCRQRRYDEALRAYRMAREQVDARPRSLGIGWILIRAQIGLAKSFHPVAMRREEQKSLEEALSLFESKEGFDFCGIWDGGDAEIFFELASYHALANRHDEAIESLQHAVERGWRETPRLRSEPTLETIRGRSEMQAILSELSSLPPIP